MAKLSNPLAFTRGPVTVITTLTYLAIITILIIISAGPPSAPTNSINGLNLTEAWDDLQTISAQYHPYNSRRNDETRRWLLQRIDEILASNNASSTKTYVFDDRTSNLTFSSAGNTASVYFEGLNIVVYIQGAEDDKSEWWNKPNGKPSERSGVLVNAHFDSVSTGFGATDDGVGVISVLQLLRYWTTADNQPKHGLVLLLNNGEEDYLNGAYVFSQHPMSKFVSSFLNLEGAGAGGRAALFRSTDEEVTQAYASSPYPFGSVISGDAFERGLVRSQTDYIVFNGKLGMRGLDVAFIEPRARYHTDQDDSRHTGKDAMWHMLSASLATTRALVASSPRVNDDNDQPHPGIWFDLFGRAMVCMQTHTFFALAVTLLVVGPVLLLACFLLLYRSDKKYLFSGSRKIHSMGEDETVPINGWRGFFRFPFVFILSCAAPVALAYLLFKVNPYIAHNSEWAVWAMMFSSFFFVAWFFSRALDYARPSALTRVYGLSWLFGIWWLLLVAAVVLEEQFHLAAGYFTLFYFACTLLATFLAYVELFTLPTKSKYCQKKLGIYPESRGTRSRSVSRPVSRSTNRDELEGSVAGDHDEEDATERSSLLRNRGRVGNKNYLGPKDDDQASQLSKIDSKNPYNEQEWSRRMWSWLWLLQFLFLIPFNVILLGQLGLFMVAALHQTGQDGSSMFIVYLAMAILAIMVISPMIPFIHRFTWQIPIFLFLVLAATILYNLLAFPFSSQSRLKLFFQQEVDLHTGANNVSLTGVAGHVQDAISYIPSAQGQNVQCIKVAKSMDRTKCVWTGEMPNVVETIGLYNKSRWSYRSWVNYNVSMTHIGENTKTARFHLQGKNTRSCRLMFNTNITDFHVAGQAPVDKRFPVINEGKTNEIRLWHREWSQPWTVDVTWKYDKKATNGTGLSGRVICIWSDANQRDVIPALDEVRHYVPEWVAITKAADGLVEGFKSFDFNGEPLPRKPNQPNQPNKPDKPKEPEKPHEPSHPGDGDHEQPGKPGDGGDDKRPGKPPGDGDHEQPRKPGDGDDNGSPGDHNPSKKPGDHQKPEKPDNGKHKYERQ